MALPGKCRLALLLWSLQILATQQRRLEDASSLLQEKMVRAEECDLLHPLEGLKWTHSKKVGNNTVYSGNLTVPLSPHAEDKDDTPFLDLLVMLVVPPGPGPSEPLLVHCGGPGSDATCVLGNSIQGYAGFSISQRGIGVTANPNFECDPSYMKFPPKGKSQYEISDFTDCPCALPDGAPLVGQSFANLDPNNDSQVEVLFRSMAARSRRCAADSKWMLTGPRGKKYNFLEWSGTRMLAHDIDFFRSRICAPKLNLNGDSYGTAVAAVYADMFPDRVAKMVINGNMPPEPNTLEFAKGQGMALTQAFGHLERMCVKWTSTHPCDYFSDEMSLTKAWNALIGEIRAGRLTAPTNLPAMGQGGNVSFPLSIGLLQGYVQELMIIAVFVPTGWAKPVLTLVNLAGMRGQSARDQVAKILDRYCTLPTGYSGEWSGIKTWRVYGVCIGQQSVGLSSSESDSRLEGLGVPMRRKGVDGFVNEGTVLGQDLFGRFTVAQAMGAYRAFRAEWEEMATSSFVGIFSAFFSWDAEAIPVQTGFRAGVRALVVGNLYDPACSYTWSNHMRESLPNAVMMTWQGVGHCLTPGGNYPNSGMQPCLDRLEQYWKTGELPFDGYTCRTEAPVPLGNWSTETD
eukprot:s73_g13.t2